jgi:hypothetical protein
MSEQFEFVWCGRPSTELTREELLDVIKHMAEEREQMRESARTALEMMRLRP